MIVKLCNCLTKTCRLPAQLSPGRLQRYWTSNPSESKRSNFKISFLFRRHIKKCPGTRSPILSHHNFLMGSLDDSCQSNICSAFPLSRGAPVDLYLTSAGKQCGGREGPRFPVSRRRTEKDQEEVVLWPLFTLVEACLFSPLFFSPLMCPAKKCFTREQEVKFFSSKWMAISHHLAPEGN